MPLRTTLSARTQTARQTPSSETKALCRLRISMRSALFRKARKAHHNPVFWNMSVPKREHIRQSPFYRLSAFPAPKPFPYPRQKAQESSPRCQLFPCNRGASSPKAENQDDGDRIAGRCTRESHVCRPSSVAPPENAYMQASARTYIPWQNPPSL